MGMNRGGRPKKALVEKRVHRVPVLFNESEYQKLQEMAKGSINLSEFIRVRLFYNSTFQQVQPEDFISTLQGMLSNIQESKAAISQCLSTLNEAVSQSGDISSAKNEFNQLLEEYKKQIKNEKNIGRYMRNMLKAGRKTGF